MSGEHEKQAVDVTDIGNWTEVVVEVGKETWWPVLLQVYPMIDSELRPHYRLSMCDTGQARYGLAIRLVAREESDSVRKLLEHLKGKKLRASVNPKLKGYDEMACLSGWFAGTDHQLWKKTCDDWRLPMSTENIRFLVNLWHQMSELAVRALQGGLRLPRQRGQTGHQLLNMIALKEQGFYDIVG